MESRPWADADGATVAVRKVDTVGGSELSTICGRLVGWSAEHAVILLGCSVLFALMAVTLLVALLALRRSERRAVRDNGRGTAAPVRHVDRELDFILDFISELSQLLSELETQSELRKIPEVLCDAMVRIFHAEQAMVLVRRRKNRAEPGAEDRLIVASLAAPERGIHMGTEVVLGDGHVGTVAQCQRVLDRREFERHHDTDASSWPVFDVAAPMVANGRTLGVVAFSRAHRQHPRAKEILRMVAQLGAMTSTNIATFRNVKAAADVDELTAIFNKRSLQYKLSEMVYGARDSGHRVSVFLFDIDNFKNYNDTNGHLAGDHLLRALAHLVRECVRSDDVFGRFGGEEFMLLLPGRAQSEAMQAAENIRRCIAEYNFPNGDKQPLGRLTVSGGVATFPDDGRDAVDVVQAADKALYRAKDAGRNRVCAAEVGLNPGWSG